MGPDFDFHAVRRADAAVVTHHRFAGSSAPDAERTAFAAWVEERIERGIYVGRLARRDDAVVAGAGVVLLDWGPTRGNPSGVCGRIVAVYTEPAWRRRGLAETLLRQVLDSAAAQGVCDFRLAASADGAHVYRKLGFRSYEAEMILKMPL